MTEIRCDYIHCFAGVGVAGHGRCFLFGDPGDPNCPRFEDEDKMLAVYRYEDQQEWIAGNIDPESWFFVATGRKP